ncbi:MAG: CBS domain-containing protein [Actinomycetia bacterium]|nr:CBS domain-containing protein [Actinomycetota bacterium]MBU4240358.1 CBS domain-containing protein [Actinomycetota bacterium]MCG2796322.1 CBS domain-containing protein [Actinomycetes bacterium]
MERSQKQPYLTGKVEDVMTVDPLTIAEDEPIYALVDLFLSHHFHGVPVVNAEGRLVGIARDSEILAIFVAREPFMVKSHTVGDIMHKPPFTISPDATIQRAATKMFVDGTRFLVVVGEGQKIKGIVTRIDLIEGIRWKDADQ